MDPLTCLRKCRFVEPLLVASIAIVKIRRPFYGCEADMCSYSF